MPKLCSAVIFFFLVIKYDHESLFFIKHTYLQLKGDPRCVGPAGPNGTCFLPTQVVDINNCWLAVNKDDLLTSEGILEVVAYNQALLTTSTTFQVNGIYNNLDKWIIWIFIDFFFMSSLCVY